MDIAIGGYLLMMVAKGSPTTIDLTVKIGQVVKAFDSAESCESARTKSGENYENMVCIPALATINR